MVGSVVGQSLIIADGHDEHDADKNGGECHPQVLPQAARVETEHVRKVIHPFLDAWID